MSRTYLEATEEQKLEQSTTDLRDKLLIKLLFHLGCRISEALAREVNDVDFAQGTVTIQRLKSRIRLNCPRCGAGLGRSYAFCPKCGVKTDKALAKEQEHRRMRTLPLDNETINLLRDYINRGGAVNQKGKQLIFSINRHRGWQIVKEYAEGAELPKIINPETGKTHNISPHRLRDAFAADAMKHDGSGDGLRLLQEHLGHVSFNTIAKYRKVAGQELKQWYHKLWEKEIKPNESSTQ